MAGKKEKNVFDIDIEEMIKAGLHFGHSVSKLHPQMKPFVFGVKNTVFLVDLEKTAEKLEGALKFIEELTKEGKILLFVGTKIQHRKLIKETASECGLPYISERWLGGTLTNFQVMKSRIKHLKETGEKKKSGELEKYTKKEKAKIDKELQSLEKKFSGIKEMEKLPDAIFVSDIEKDSLAVREARDKGIPVVAICDTNVDPTLVDHPIPANDDALSSVRYILDKVKGVILKAKESKKENKE